MSESHVVRILLPVRRGREANLQLSLDHLRKLGVTDWAGITVISHSNAGPDPDSFGDWIVADREAPTWGELVQRGLDHARELEADFVFWVEPGVLPRSGVLERLFEISRCRKSIVGAGQLKYHCQTKRGGGFSKSIFKLGRKSVNRGEMVRCDAVSDHCACVPLHFVPALTRGAEGKATFWNAIDFSLILSRNGIPCLIDGESAVSVQRCPLIENESWLLTERPKRELWHRFPERDSEQNLRKRVRFFLRHWSLIGLVPALFPWFKLVLITMIRFFVPVRVLRKIYGRHSTAWQLQQVSLSQPNA